MKNKDSVVYIVFILSFALFVLSPAIIDNVFAQDAPVTSVFNTWLVYGENFVNSMVFNPGL
ncbi:MAG: hypothetical protein R3F50_09100 [Gammaproteobacteria bacterium]